MLNQTNILSHAITNNEDIHELHVYYFEVVFNNIKYLFRCNAIRNEIHFHTKYNYQQLLFSVMPTPISFQFTEEHNKQNIEAIATRILNLLVFS